MKKTSKIILNLLFVSLLTVSGSAMAGTVTSSQYGMYGPMSGLFGNHYGSFKVADLDLDGVNEIILLDGATLAVVQFDTSPFRPGRVVLAELDRVAGQGESLDRERVDEVPVETLEPVVDELDVAMVFLVADALFRACRIRHGGPC